MADETVNPEKLAAKRARLAAYMREYTRRNSDRINSARRSRNKARRAVLTAQEQATRNRERARNPEAFRAKNAEKTRKWRATNYDRYLLDRRAYNSRYLADPNRKIAEYLRSRLTKAIRGKTKGGHAIRDLGCSIQEFRAHIERQFRRGMNWENWRPKGWHLDHIRPLSMFDLTDPDEFKEAAHFTNYRPIWWRENLKKSSSRSLLL